MEVQDTLRRTKEVLLNEGWTQGHARTWTGEGFSYCISGAISQACVMPFVGSSFLQMHDERASEYQAAIEALSQTLGSFAIPSYGIINYNDARGRTLDDMIELIDLTLARVVTDDHAAVAEEPHQEAQLATA